jgi:hypothetical protein
MNQDNKRKSKLVGMNEDKMNAIKKMREVRNGGKRLEQAIEVRVLI